MGNGVEIIIRNVSERIIINLIIGKVLQQRTRKYYRLRCDERVHAKFNETTTEANK